MIYFSELQNTRVHTDTGRDVGKLHDIVFLGTDTPRITAIVVRAQGQFVLIRMDHIKTFAKTLVIHNGYTPSHYFDNELLIGKNLLDHQIIDINGNKIVRVNDIAINEKPTPYLAGVDITLWGVLRWFKLEQRVARTLRVFGIKAAPRLLSWADIQPLELSRGKVVLNTEVVNMKKIRPEDLADYLEETNIANVDRVLKTLSPEYGAEVIESLNVTYRTALFRRFSAQKAAQVLNLIDPDDAVDILLTVGERKRKSILENLPEDKHREIRYLLQLAKTPIGEKLTSEYITVSPNNTVAEVLEKVRRESATFDFVNNIYVINDEQRLIGVFDLHELIMQNSTTPVYRFMVTNPVVVYLTTPEEIVLKKMVK